MTGDAIYDASGEVIDIGALVLLAQPVLGRKLAEVIELPGDGTLVALVEGDYEGAQVVRSSFHALVEVLGSEATVVGYADCCKRYLPLEELSTDDEALVTICRTCYEAEGDRLVAEGTIPAALAYATW